MQVACKSFLGRTEEVAAKYRYGQVVLHFSSAF